MTEQTYNVSGMSCASCAAHVKKALEKLPGVENGDVNLTAETATVRFDEAAVDFAAMQKAVENAGFGLAERQRPSIETNACH